MKHGRLIHSISGRFFCCALLAILLLGAILYSMTVGALKLSVSEIFSILCHPSPDAPYQILFNIRLPRVILGALAGSSLALSGTILQGVMRNPLASPGIIGVSAGGGLAGILILLALPQFSGFLVPAAFLGAFSTTVLVYLLAWRRGIHPVRLILAGVAVSAMLSAFSSAIMLFHAENVGSVLNFTIGSLSTRGWPQVAEVFWYIVIGTTGALLLSGQLNVLSLGDEIAAGLGLRVEWSRFLLLGTAALLAAAAVSVAGLLGFVGLIAPHMVRLIIGPDNRFLLPGAAFFGAMLVVICDTIGRIIMEPAELPVGIIMALLGPPFFLWLLRRYRYEA